MGPRCSELQTSFWVCGRCSSLSERVIVAMLSEPVIVAVLNEPAIVAMLNGPAVVKYVMWRRSPAVTRLLWQLRQVPSCQFVL